MFSSYSLILIITGLVLIIYQDLRFRRIHILAAGLILVGAFLYVGIDQIFYSSEVWLIYGFLALNFFIVFIYISLKNGILTNPFRSQIGLGDFVFLVAIAPIFYLKSYILFFVFGMLFSLVLFAFLKPILKQKTIPLAGYLSILMLGMIIMNEATQECDIFLNFNIGHCI